MGVHRHDEWYSLWSNFPTKDEIIGASEHCWYATKLITGSCASETQIDVRPLRNQIDSELLALEEKRQRRKTEVALIKNRKDVETLYNRLRSERKYEYLPSLPTFRQLPVIQLLQSGIYDQESGTTISHTLQHNPLMRQQLDQDIKRCIETAKQDLAVMLGFPRAWKSANKRILHPAVRPTAWFLCTNCGIDGTDHKVDGCLDFAAACHHVCQSKDGKNDRYRRSKKGAWNPEGFVVDEKVRTYLIYSIQLQCSGSQARDVMKRALFKLKVSDETAHLKQYGLGVLCTSCEPSMVVDSRNLVRVLFFMCSAPDVRNTQRLGWTLSSTRQHGIHFPWSTRNYSIS